MGHRYVKKWPVNRCWKGKPEDVLVLGFSQIPSHSADVLSFADNSNIPGEIATGVIDLCSRWVQSASTDYDVLFGSVLTPRWAMEHKPVLSRKGLGHVLYTKATTAEPDGELIVCHNDCGAILDTHSGSQRIRFVCTDCESTTFVPLIVPKRTGILGKNGLVRTPFPQSRYPATWKHRDPTRPMKFQLPPTSEPPTSWSAPTPHVSILPPGHPSRPHPSSEVKVPLQRVARTPSLTSSTESPLPQEGPPKKRKTAEEDTGLEKKGSKNARRPRT